MTTYRLYARFIDPDLYPVIYLGEEWVIDSSSCEPTPVQAGELDEVIRIILSKPNVEAVVIWQVVYVDPARAEFADFLDKLLHETASPQETDGPAEPLYC